MFSLKFCDEPSHFVKLRMEEETMILWKKINFLKVKTCFTT